MTAEEYLRRVDFWLRDLPWSTRRELVSELRGHLSELPADEVGSLGEPEDYAADLRSAAGLERHRGAIAFLRARRPRNLILAAAALTVTVLAIGFAAWVDSYQPIAFAGAIQFPVDAKPSRGQAGETVVFRKGRPFQYGIAIQNTGRFTVRVLGVPKSVTDFYAGHLLMSEDQTGRLSEKPLESFHPFEMKPGSYRWLLLEGVYACTTGMGHGTRVSWEGISVRFSFLWRTATASIPTDEPLSLGFRRGCPATRP